MDRTLSRQEALEELERFGISGEEVYLIDLIPLLEILWADGMRQDAEVELVNEFASQHVERINTIAGYEVLTVGAARAFVERFLHERPHPGLLELIRRAVRVVRLSSSDEAVNEEARDSLLRACLDIGSAAVTRYPYGLHERFNPLEKATFFEILNSLDEPA